MQVCPESFGVKSTKPSKSWVAIRHMHSDLKKITDRGYRIMSRFLRKKKINLSNISEECQPPLWIKTYVILFRDNEGDTRYIIDL